MRQVSKENLAMAYDLDEIEAILAEELEPSDIDFCCGYNLYCNADSPCLIRDPSNIA